MTTTTKVRTPQKMIRDWIVKWSEGREVIDLEEMSEAARERFEDDEEFNTALVGFALDEMVPDEARKVFNATRRISMGTESLTVDAFDKRVEADDRWHRWRRRYESVGDKRRLLLLSMTKADLVIARDIRSRRATGELAEARFLGELAKKMHGEQTVQERFTPQEIEAIRERVNKTIRKQEAA